MKRRIAKHRQILFFIIVGVVSVLIEVLMMKVFSYFIPLFFPQEVDFYGVKYIFSNIFSTFCAILANYWLSIKFVFQRGKYGKQREFTYFVLFSLVTMGLSLFIFQIFIHFIFTKPLDFKIYVFSPVILSKIMAIGIVSVLNYTIKKRFIFNG